MNKLILIITVFITFLSGIISVSALEYNFLSTKSIQIELIPTEELSTKEGIIEGKELGLLVAKNVYHNEHILVKEGTTAYARVETVITAGMNGFPAEIIISHFEIPGINSAKILGEYSCTGQNRCLWVYPLKWILTFLPPTGSLTNFIYGGHARIKTTDRIVVYYYPEWTE